MVQGRQSLQRGHLFKVEEGGIPGAEQNTPSENGGSAPGNRPCGEFVVVPRTPPPFWSRAGLFLGKLITVQLQSIGAVHGIWDTGSREWGYRLWASGGANNAQKSSVYAVSGQVSTAKLKMSIDGLLHAHSFLVVHGVPRDNGIMGKLPKQEVHGRTPTRQ